MRRIFGVWCVPLVLVVAACSGGGDASSGGAGSSGTSGSSGASSGDTSSSSGASGSSGASSGDTSSSGGASSGSSGANSSGGADAGGGGGAPLAPGDSTLTIDAAGKTRSVLLHVPAAAANGAVPLVIALHGNGDTNTNFVATAGLTQLADADGFVLAAPQGITQTFTYMGTTVPGVDWDAYRPVSGGNIDVPLLDAIRTQLAASSSIDAHHIVVYGYSQGGYMSFRYGMDASASLSCAAVLAAADPTPGSGLVTNAARKIPVAIQIGDQDYNINGARSTKQELTQNGNPLSYVEIAGAGHVPIPGDPKAPLEWCRGQTLP